MSNKKISKHLFLYSKQYELCMILYNIIAKVEIYCVNFNFMTKLSEISIA